jgi:hypothetical protein
MIWNLLEMCFLGGKKREEGYCMFIVQSIATLFHVFHHPKHNSSLNNTKPSAKNTH